MSDLPKRKIIKVIALLVSILLVWQGVVWANPDIFRRNTLQPTSFFSPTHFFDSCSHGFTAYLMKFLAEAERDPFNHNIHRMAICAEEAIAGAKEALLAEIDKKDVTPEDLAGIKRRIENMFSLDPDTLPHGFFVIDLGPYSIRYYSPDQRGARDPNPSWRVMEEMPFGKYLCRQKIAPVSSVRNEKKKPGKYLEQAIADGHIEFAENITPGVIKRAHAELSPDQTDQNLKYIVLTDKNGEPLYRIDPGDEIFIGHFRDDRASYFALGLQRHGFRNLTGWIPFSEKYVANGGKYILPKEAMGEVPHNYFGILHEKGRTVRIVSENEKKKHVGRNAHGRREKLWPNEKQVSIPMKPTTCEYADVPEMNTGKVANQVMEWLDDPGVTDIIANMLSSDMMKHTGNFEAAKKGNEITDVNLGRIKVKIDWIRDKFLREVEDILGERGSDALMGALRNKDFDEFLVDVRNTDAGLAGKLKELSKKVPILVITADHGASEAGLAAKLEGSNTAHTANRVPYIIYDPLRKRKIRLKEGKTIRNNAPTLLHLLGYSGDIPECYEESLLPDDYRGYERRMAEIILDGWGINPDRGYPYDAIRLAHTPNYDWLRENASFTQVAAHGEVIGLRKILSQEEGPHHDRGLQPGATDIGHLHFFSGRLVKQPICLVDGLIDGGLSNGVFDENKAEIGPVVEKMLRVIEEDRKFHHIAFSSEGGVHACLSHMYALMRLAKKLGMRKDQFVIHFVAEGRDVLIPRSAHLFLEDVQREIDKTGIGVVASAFGRADWVRKDGYEHQTDRAVGMLSGDFKMFVEGTRRMTGESSGPPGGHIVSGDVNKLYDEFLRQQEKTPARKLEGPFRRRLLRARKDLTKRVNRSTLTKGTKDIIREELKRSSNLTFWRFKAVILLDDEDRRTPAGWLLGFNTARDERSRADGPLNTIEDRLSFKFPNAVAFSTEVLDVIASDELILREYLLHEVICRRFGHEKSRSIQEQLFPENYADILGDTEKGHMDGELGLALKRVILERCEPVFEGMVTGDKLDKELEEFRKEGFTGEGPRKAIEFYSRYKEWYNWVKRVLMPLQSRINRDKSGVEKAREDLLNVEKRYRFVVTRLEWIWEMGDVWAEIVRFLDSHEKNIEMLSGEEVKEIKPVFMEFLDKYEKFMQEDPGAAQLKDFGYVKEVIRAIREAVGIDKTPLMPGGQEKPAKPSEKKPAKDKKTWELTKKEKNILDKARRQMKIEEKITDISFREKLRLISWKRVFAVFAVSLVLSGLLYLVLPVNRLTVSIAVVVPLAVFAVIIAMNWSWKNLLVALGISALLSMFLPVPWFGLSLAVVIMAQMAFRRSARFAGQRLSGADRKAVFPGTEKEPALPKEVRKILDKIQIDKDIFPYIARIMLLIPRSGKKDLKGTKVSNAQAFLDAVLEISTSEYIPDISKLKDELRPLVREKLQDLELLDFDPRSGFRKLKNWKNESDTELADALDNAAQEATRLVSSRSTGEESSKEMLAIRELTGEYYGIDKDRFEEIHLYLILLTLRSQVESDEKIGNVKAEAYYDLGRLEFHFNNYLAAERAFGNAVREASEHRDSGELDADCLFALGFVRHYLWKWDGARDAYRFSLNAREMKKDLTKLDRIKTKLTRLLIKKVEKRISLAGNKVGDNDIRGKEADEGENRNFSFLPLALLPFAGTVPGLSVFILLGTITFFILQAGMFSLAGEGRENDPQRPVRGVMTAREAHGRTLIDLEHSIGMEEAQTQEEKDGLNAEYERAKREFSKTIGESIDPHGKPERGYVRIVSEEDLQRVTGYLPSYLFEKGGITYGRTAYNLRPMMNYSIPVRSLRLFVNEGEFSRALNDVVLQDVPRRLIRQYMDTARSTYDPSEILKLIVTQGFLEKEAPKDQKESEKLAELPKLGTGFETLRKCSTSTMVALIAEAVWTVLPREFKDEWHRLCDSQKRGLIYFRNIRFKYEYEKYPEVFPLRMFGDKFDRLMNEESVFRMLEKEDSPEISRKERVFFEHVLQYLEEVNGKGNDIFLVERIEENERAMDGTFKEFIAKKGMPSDEERVGILKEACAKFKKAADQGKPLSNNELWQSAVDIWNLYGDDEVYGEIKKDIEAIQTLAPDYTLKFQILLPFWHLAITHLFARDLWDESIDLSSKMLKYAESDSQISTFENKISGAMYFIKGAMYYYLAKSYYQISGYSEACENSEKCIATIQGHLSGMSRDEKKQKQRIKDLYMLLQANIVLSLSITRLVEAGYYSEGKLQEARENLEEALSFAEDSIKGAETLYDSVGKIGQGNLPDMESVQMEAHKARMHALFMKGAMTRGKAGKELVMKAKDELDYLVGRMESGAGFAFDHPQIIVFLLGTVARYFLEEQRPEDAGGMFDYAGEITEKYLLDLVTDFEYDLSNVLMDLYMGNYAAAVEQLEDIKRDIAGQAAAPVLDYYTAYAYLQDSSRGYEEKEKAVRALFKEHSWIGYSLRNIYYACFDESFLYDFVTRLVIHDEKMDAVSRAMLVLLTLRKCGSAAHEFQKYIKENEAAAEEDSGLRVRLLRLMSGITEISPPGTVEFIENLNSLIEDKEKFIADACTAGDCLQRADAFFREEDCEKALIYADLGLERLQKEEKESPLFQVSPFEGLKEDKDIKRPGFEEGPYISERLLKLKEDIGNFESAMVEARRQFENKELEKAVKALEKALDIYKPYLLVASYMTRSVIGGMIRHYKTCVTIENRFREGAFDKALSQIEKLETEGGLSPEVLSFIGKKAARIGDIQKEITSIKERFESGDLSLRSARNQARDMQKECPGYPDAKELFEYFEQKRIEVAGYLDGAGSSIELRRPDEAFSLIRKAMAIDKENKAMARPLVRIAELYIQGKDFDSARKCIDILIDVEGWRDDPTAEKLIVLIWELCRSGRYGDAIELSDRLFEKKISRWYKTKLRRIKSVAGASTILDDLDIHLAMIRNALEAEKAEEAIEQKILKQYRTRLIEYKKISPTKTGFRIDRFKHLKPEEVRKLFKIGDSFEVFGPLPDGDKSESNGPVVDVSFRVTAVGERGWVAFEMPPSALEKKEEFIRDIPRRGFIRKQPNIPFELQKSVLDDLKWKLWESLRAVDYEAIGKKAFFEPTTGHPIIDIVLGLKEAPKRKGSVSYGGEGPWDEWQRKAIASATDLSIPVTIIHGPGGTGKTTVTVEATRQLSGEIIRQFSKKKSRILITSQSNPAVDNIWKRAASKGLKFIRLAFKSSSIDTKVMRNWERRQKHLEDARKRYYGEEGAGPVYIGTNMGWANDPYVRNSAFYLEPDVVIIDEGGRSTPGETLYAISRIKPDGKVIIVGDHLQLRPHGFTREDVVRIKSALSYKERELERLYTEENLSKVTTSLFEKLCQRRDIDYHLLPVNRRSHPAITGFVNAFGYLRHGVKLLPRDWDKEKKEPCEKDIVTVIDYGDGKIHERLERDGQDRVLNGRIYNTREVNEVIAEIDRFLNMKHRGRPRYGPADITIITPYKAQIRAITEALKIKAIVNDLDEGVIADRKEAVAVLSDLPLRKISKRMFPHIVQDVKIASGMIEELIGKLKNNTRISPREMRIYARIIRNAALYNIRKKHGPRSVGYKDITSIRRVKLTAEGVEDEEEVMEGDEELDVATIDSIQGSENKVIIWSLVRSNRQNDIGFLGAHDGPNRNLVAAGRAEEYLTVIGDISHTLAWADYGLEKTNYSDLRKASIRQTAAAFRDGLEHCRANNTIIRTSTDRRTGRNSENDRPRSPLGGVHEGFLQLPMRLFFRSAAYLSGALLAGLTSLLFSHSAKDPAPIKKDIGEKDTAGYDRIESDPAKIDPARLTEALKEHLGFLMFHDKDARAQISKYLEDKKCLTAVTEDGEVAGCLIFTVDEEKLSARQMDIYVRCYQADRGIGRALWEEAKEYFARKGITKAEALCDRPVQRDFWEHIRENYGGPLEMIIRDRDEGAERFYSVYAFAPLAFLPFVTVVPGLSILILASTAAFVLLATLSSRGDLRRYEKSLFLSSFGNARGSTNDTDNIDMEMLYKASRPITIENVGIPWAVFPKTGVMNKIEFRSIPCSVLDSSAAVYRDSKRDKYVIFIASLLLRKKHRSDIALYFALIDIFLVLHDGILERSGAFDPKRTNILASQGGFYREVVCAMLNGGMAEEFRIAARLETELSGREKASFRGEDVLSEGDREHSDMEKSVAGRSIINFIEWMKEPEVTVVDFSGEIKKAEKVYRPARTDMSARKHQKRMAFWSEHRQMIGRFIRGEYRDDPDRARILRKLDGAESLVFIKSGIVPFSRTRVRPPIKKGVRSFAGKENWLRIRTKIENGRLRIEYLLAGDPYFAHVSDSYEEGSETPLSLGKELIEWMTDKERPMPQSVLSIEADIKGRVHLGTFDGESMYLDLGKRFKETEGGLRRKVWIKAKVSRRDAKELAVYLRPDGPEIMRFRPIYKDASGKKLDRLEKRKDLILDMFSRDALVHWAGGGKVDMDSDIEFIWPVEKMRIVKLGDDMVASAGVDYEGDDILVRGKVNVPGEKRIEFCRPDGRQVPVQVRFYDEESGTLLNELSELRRRFASWEAGEDAPNPMVISGIFGNGFEIAEDVFVRIPKAERVKSGRYLVVFAQPGEYKGIKLYALNGQNAPLKFISTYYFHKGKRIKTGWDEEAELLSAEDESAIKEILCRCGYIAFLRESSFSADKLARYILQTLGRTPLNGEDIVKVTAVHTHAAGRAIEKCLSGLVGKGKLLRTGSGMYLPVVRRKCANMGHHAPKISLDGTHYAFGISAGVSDDATVFLAAEASNGKKFPIAVVKDGKPVLWYRVIRRADGGVASCGLRSCRSEIELLGRKGTFFFENWRANTKRGKGRGVAGRIGDTVIKGKPGEYFSGIVSDGKIVRLDVWRNPCHRPYKVVARPQGDKGVPVYKVDKDSEAYKREYTTKEDKIRFWERELYDLSGAKRRKAIQQLEKLGARFDGIRALTLVDCLNSNYGVSEGCRLFVKTFGVIVDACIKSAWRDERSRKELLELLYITDSSVIRKAFRGIASRDPSLYADMLGAYTKKYSADYKNRHDAYHLALLEALRADLKAKRFDRFPDRALDVLREWYEHKLRSPGKTPHIRARTKEYLKTIENFRKKSRNFRRKNKIRLYSIDPFTAGLAAAGVSSLFGSIGVSILSPLVLTVAAIIFSFSWFAAGGEDAGKGKKEDAKAKGPQKDSPLAHLPDLHKRFAVKKKIGVGGMGVVYLVFDVNLRREAALKILFDQSERARERFRREIKRLRSLRHPNIVKVLGSSSVRKDYKGPSYIVMEYVEGESLMKFYRKRKYNNEKALLELISDILLPVAKGIRYIHGKNIIHRDLKPDNILISKTGVPKIADFGIAKLGAGATRSDEHSLTKTGYVVGSPSYMAPETFRNMIETWIPDDIESLLPDKKSPGYKEWKKSPRYKPYEYLKELRRLVNKRQFKKMSVQADIYSLGLIFCETCTGKLPFKYEGDDGIKKLRSKVFERIPLDEIAPKLYSEFRKLIEDMLDLDPNKRPTSKQLVRKLERIEKKLKKRLEEKKKPVFKTVLKYGLIAAGIGATALVTHLLFPGLIRSILNWLGIGFILTAGTMVSVTGDGGPGTETEELSRSSVKDLLALENELSDSSAEVRADAIAKLGPVYTAFIGQGRDVRDRVFNLEQKLADNHPAVREAAGSALRSIYAALAAETKSIRLYESRLRRRMGADVREVSVRRAAVTALGLLYAALIDHGRKIDVSMLEQRLKDPDMQVSEAAANALSSVYVAQINAKGDVDISALEQRLNADRHLVREKAIKALGPVYRALIEKGKQVDLSDLKKMLGNACYWQVRRAATTALGLVYVSLIEQGRKEEIDLPLLREMLNDIDLGIRRVAVSAVGEVYAALIRQGEKVDFSDIEEKLNRYDEELRRRAAEQLSLIHDALEGRDRETDLSSPEETGPAGIAGIESGIILDQDYAKYLFWTREKLPYHEAVIDEYLASSQPQIFISDLKRRAERCVRKGFDPEDRRQLWLAFVGAKLNGIDITHHDFTERVERLVEFDEKHPGYFSDLFGKNKKLKAIEIAAGETHVVDTSEVDHAVLDAHLEELSSIKERVDSCRWLSEDFPKHKYFNLRNLYYQLKREQARQAGEYTGGKFFIILPSEDRMREEIAGNRKLFYRIVFKAAYLRLGDREISGNCLELMRDLVISDILSDDAMKGQLHSSDPETRVTALKVFYEDYKNHLPDASGIGMEKVRGLQKALDELSGEIYAEMAKIKIVRRKRRETYRLIPQGFLSVFRGRAGIIDCSFDAEYHGSAFTRAMHEDTGYYFVYNKKLKGYVGLCEGLTEKGEKVLTVDTINSPSLDGEEMLINLFVELEEAARELGCKGIALPENMVRSFNFDNKYTISGMDAYRKARPIKVVPVHSSSWKRLADTFGKDSYNSMESGRFKLLDLDSLRPPAPVSKSYEDGDIGIEQVDARGWPEIKDDIMKVEEESFTGPLRQTEEDISETFEDPDSICLVLKDKGAIVGYMMGGPLEDYYYLAGIEEDPGYGEENTVYIESIALLRPYQRSGLGKKLRNKFLDIAQQRGYRQVSGHIREEVARSRGDNILGAFGEWQGTDTTFCYYSNPIRSKKAEKKHALRLISELVTRSQDHDWEAADRAGELPDLKGLLLGATDGHGRITFRPVRNYPFEWAMLGSEEKGWEAVVSESGVRNGRFEFTVRFTKEGREPVKKVFQVGPYTRELTGRNKAEGKTLTVLDIDDRPGLKAVAELIARPPGYNWETAENDGRIPDLKGLRLGAVDGRGRINFSPVKGYPFQWHVLGFYEEGWEAVIVETEAWKEYFQFSVELTKPGREPLRKVFQIGSLTKDLSGQYTEKGKTCKVLDIDDRLGLRAISGLITRPQDYDWGSAVRDGRLPDLRGLRLGVTGTQGKISFHPVTNYLFQWHVLGFDEEGWEAVIVGSSVHNGHFQFLVKLTREGREPIHRIFQIGPYARIIYGQNRERRTKRHVLDIVSLRAVERLMNKEEYVRKNGKAAWNERTNVYEVASPETLDPVESEELVQKVSQNLLAVIASMTDEEREIVLRIVRRDTGHNIVSEGYAPADVLNVKRKINSALNPLLDEYGLIGKHAVVKGIRADEKTGEMTARIKIVGSDEEVPPLILSPGGKLDVRALKTAFESMEEVKSKYNKGMILSMLDLLEGSPPELYTYDVLVEDLFGFVSGERDLIALHESAASDPMALFHEAGEYLIKKKILKLKLRHERLVISTGKRETFTLNLGGEALAVARKNTASPHYLFRALQRQIFKERDGDLTVRIKNEQKKKLSHSTIKNILIIGQKLDDRDWRVATAAIKTLASIYIFLIKQGKDVDLAAFKRKIKNKDWYVRKAAFAALKRVCDAQAEQVKGTDEEALGLIREFEHTYRWQNIETAPESMDAMLINMFEWGQMSLAELEGKTGSNDMKVSEAAAKALCSVYITAFNEGGIPRSYLERQLNDKNWYLRRAAMAALSSIYADLVRQGEKVDLSLFEEGLEHDYWRFKEGRPLLDAVYVSLVREGKMSSSDIEQKLDHRQLHIQESATKALGPAYMIEVKQGRVPLSALKQKLDHHKDWRVRRAALSALEPFCIDAIEQDGVLDDDYEKHLIWQKEGFPYQEEVFSRFLASPRPDDPRRFIDSLFRQRILEGMEKDVMPCLVNALIAVSERKEKVILALDIDLGEGQINTLLEKLIRVIPALKDNNEDLKRFLDNLHVIKGTGRDLSLRLNNVTDPSRGSAKKEDVIIVTKDSNAEHFRDFKGAATMAVVDDGAFPETAYLPLLEIMLFAISKHLGWDKKALLKYYGMIPNVVSVEDLNPGDYAGLFGGDERLLVIRLVPDAVQFDKEELREMMDSIKVMLARA